MFRDCIFSDPPVKGTTVFPSWSALTLKSAGCDLYGVIYHPGGEGPHPTMVLFHGFPGTEKNGDLAQVFRRAGFNTMIFSYRGAWGSHGSFSFSNVIGDGRNVTNWLRSDEARKSYAVDEERIVLAGHSMGGSRQSRLPRHVLRKGHDFLSGWNIGLDGERSSSDPKTAEKLRGLLDLSSPPLAGTTPDALWDEVMEHGEAFDLRNSVPSFAGRNVCSWGVTGRNNAPDLHHEPLAEAFRKTGNVDVSEVMIDDDHGYSASRIRLAETVLAYLEKRGY